MILYTPLPIETILENFNSPIETTIIEHEGLMIEVEPIDINEGRIIRLISTNPDEFLKPEHSPGNIIKFTQNTSLKLD